LRRTIYAARCLAREPYRRRIIRQLNKGASLHALRCEILYAYQGAIRRRHLEAQPSKAGP
jgi:TnpA family transposase